MSTTRKCAVCGKEVSEGYLFDEDPLCCFCSDEYAAKFFNDDMGCVEILVDSGERLIWHEHFADIKTFDINSVHDVAKFFLWVIFEKRVNFHPDDSFNDYISGDNGMPLFSEEEYWYYDSLMKRCFEVCEREGRDIYRIGMIVFGLEWYCQGNDELANGCLGED